MGYLGSTGLGTLWTTIKNTFALKSHTHNYAGSSSAGGPANSVAWANVTGKPELLKGDTGPQGPPGPTGSPGADGHSPSVTATKSGTVTTIKVDGSAIATINDGSKGDKGDPGAAGSNGTKLVYYGSVSWTAANIATYTAIGYTANWAQRVTGGVAVNTGDTIYLNVTNSTTGEKGILFILSDKTTNASTSAHGSVTSWVPGLNGSKGDKGDTGATGTAGHSPSVTATKSGTVTTVKVDGATIATINDGAKGDKGDPGVKGDPGSKGDPGTFVCTYGTTTPAQVAAALSAGLFPIMYYSDRMYTLHSVDSGSYSFKMITGREIRTAKLSSSGSWSRTTQNVAWSDEVLSESDVNSLISAAGASGIGSYAWSFSGHVTTSGGSTFDITPTASAHGFTADKFMFAVVSGSWPASNWNNGAVVVINRMTASGGKISATLTSTSAQTYSITMLLFYAK